MTILNDVKSALESVVEKNASRNIFELNLVSSLQEKDGVVSFILDFSNHMASLKSAPQIKQLCEQVVSNVNGVKEVNILISSPKETPAPQKDTFEKTKLKTVKHIIAVASGKGGVGKSTTALNLALSIQKLGYKTGLLDADIYGPSLPLLLAINEKPDVTDDKKLKPLSAFGLQVMSMGFMVPETSAVVWRGLMIQSAIKQMLIDVAWDDLDVLVVDMPPGTGDAHLTLSQIVTLSGAVIVTTPQDLALIDARRAVAMFEKVNVPILGIVENMSFYQCNNCGDVAHLFGHGGARREAEKLNISFLGEVPLLQDIRDACDQGSPVVLKDAQGTVSQTFLDVAQKVTAQIFKVQN